MGEARVVIRREILVIDLRPLAQDEPARFQIRYLLDGPGRAVTLDLLFISGSPGVSDFQVRLDDHPVSSHGVSGHVQPASWTIPDWTPYLGGRKLSYHPDHGKDPPAAAECRIDLSPGAHELSVRYAAEAVVNHLSRPVVSRQVVYLLSPARSWARFEKLELEILLPPRWLAESLPALTRDGDTLRGAWDGMPADALALTVGAPQGPWYRPLSQASLYLALSLAVAGIPFCILRGWARGRRIARSAEKHPAAWPSSFGSAALWWAAVAAGTLLAVSAPFLALPARQVSANERISPGYLLLVLAAELALLPLGFLLAQVTVLATRKAARGRG